jgi:hypothetical protein
VDGRVLPRHVPGNAQRGDGDPRLSPDCKTLLST